MSCWKHGVRHEALGKGGRTNQENQKSPTGRHTAPNIGEYSRLRIVDNVRSGKSLSELVSLRFWRCPASRTPAHGRPVESVL